VDLKLMTQMFTESRPVGWIRECLLKGLRRDGSKDSGVDHGRLRGAPIVAILVVKYLLGMKDGNLNVRAELARVSVGRMFLHVACAMRDKRVQWHWEGIKREFIEPCRIGRRGRSEI
jgi:hypothetical protein